MDCPCAAVCPCHERRPEQRLVALGIRPRSLRPRESEILAALVPEDGEDGLPRLGVLYTPSAILARVWGPSDRDNHHLLRVNVARMRAALHAQGFDLPWLPKRGLLLQRCESPDNPAACPHVSTHAIVRPWQTTCRDCGVTTELDYRARCFGCQEFRAARSALRRVCPDCGEDKWPASQRCLPCARVYQFAPAESRCACGRFKSRRAQRCDLCARPNSAEAHLARMVFTRAIAGVSA